MIVMSFVEESCWDRNDKRKPVRQPVVFRVTSIGKIQGERIDCDMIADFGLFYDVDDAEVLYHLQLADGRVDWGALVYWKQHDRGEIQIIDPLSDEEIGSIVVRRRMGGDPSGETDWTNVVCPVRWKVKK